MRTRNITLASELVTGRGWRYVMRFVGLVFLLVATFFFLQTEVFISLFTPPSRDEVRKAIATARAKQTLIGREYKARTGRDPESGVVILSELFGDKRTEDIKREVEFLQQDAEINNYLYDAFGVSLADANVVVIPSWAMYRPENEELLGLTTEGRKTNKRHINETDVAGFTIRDKVPQEPQLTLSGRPRIVLNDEAFLSRRTLRLTLFHELLHGINIPGRPPPRWLRRSDLCYLPEYRLCIARAQLNPYRELWLWAFVSVFLFVSGLLILMPPKDPMSQFTSLNLAGGENARSDSYNSDE